MTLLKVVFFTSIPYYYNSQSSAGINKYCYKIPISYLYTYSIVYYEGNYSSGYLFVTYDYKNLAPNVKMTKVSRNLRISLTTNISENKYFYLTNSDYNSNSSYIYIYFEDNNFGLSYNNIKYCRTSTTSSSPDSAVNECSFSLISYYNSQSSSGIKKYCYKISNTNSLAYSIVYYEGSYSSGSLYVTSDDNDLTKTVKMTQVSRNSKKSLPTTTFENKYFYLTNSNYSIYSNYIYYPRR